MSLVDEEFVLRYTPGEITVPEGAEVQDMDWIALSWTMRRNNFGGEASFTQFVLVPGASTWRRWTNTGKFNDGVLAEMNFETEPSYSYDNMLEEAQAHTETLMKDGALMIDAPFLVDFTEKNFHRDIQRLNHQLQGGLKPHSLGNALIYGNPFLARTIFMRVNQVRKVVQSKRPPVL